MSVIDRIISAESGGDPSARNPRSSATGAGQFLSSTWLDTLAKHRPDITGSPEELLALRNDPQLSKAMTDAYARDNGAILSESGLPVTPGSTYLAHFAGPKGAVSVLNADPNAPVGQILGDAVVKANPFLANMTVADLRAWADRKMGGKAAAPQQTAQAPTQVPMRAPASQIAAPMGMAGNNMSMSAQQGQTSPSLYEQMPAQQMAAAPPPIFAPQRKPIDLSKLRAALEASGNRGLLLSRG